MENKEKDKFLNPFNDKRLEDFQPEVFSSTLKKLPTLATKENKKYQIVILGAGKGTRLGVSYPKILHKLNYPTGSMSLLQNTLNNIKSLERVVEISKIFLVIDREKKPFFEHKIQEENLNIIGLESDDIRGTAISINAVKSFINPDYETIFLWGDLALWRVADMATVINLHSRVESCLAFSTRLKKSPYVAFLRSKEGVITSVIHANEMKRYQGLAEQDCLSFVCSSKALTFLKEFIESCKSSGEVDFVHFIPYLTSQGLPVLGVPIVQEGTVYGLNTLERANEINKTLSHYTKTSYIEYFQDPKS